MTYTEFLKNDKFVKIYFEDALSALKKIENETINCCITSPPYYMLRDYGVTGQIGLENTPEEYIQKLVQIFHEVNRVLRKDGTLFVNISDSYAGSGKGRKKDGTCIENNKSKQSIGQKSGVLLKTPVSGNMKRKDLIGIPWLLAFALRSDGWYLRQDIIWQKPNAMPDPVKDRCTKAHEYIFLFSKSENYYFNSDAIKEECVGKYKKNMFRNKRSVWTIPTEKCSEAHYATFPKKLIEPCILAGCPKGGTILDPFIGSGTTAIVSNENGRNCIGIELNVNYKQIILNRLDLYSKKCLTTK